MGLSSLIAMFWFSVTLPRNLVKSFGSADYQPLKFSSGSELWVSQQPVHDLQSLASVIGELEAEPTKTVIRRLSLLPENEPVARHSQNFSSTSHHWCLIDSVRQSGPPNYLSSRVPLPEVIIVSVSFNWLFYG